MPVTMDFPPRLMTTPQAAHYLGVSSSTLRSLGIPRKILGAKRLFDRLELDAFADFLESEGEVEENSCDRLFGIALDDGSDQRKPKPW